MSQPKIEIREKDGYINLNKLCKAGGKEFKEWKRNRKSKLFLEKLSKVLNIEKKNLIKFEINSHIDQANWGHPRVATFVAQWISVEFDIFVSGCIEEWKESSNKNKERYYEELNKIEADIISNEKEKEIRDKLCEELNGKVEVETRDGFIDILTDTEIIEVKTMKKWKQALGQLMIYSDYYPFHIKRIHLFDIDIYNIKYIESRLKSHNVELSYEK